MTSEAEEDQDEPFAAKPEDGWLKEVIEIVDESSLTSVPKDRATQTDAEPVVTQSVQGAYPFNAAARQREEDAVGDATSDASSAVSAFEIFNYGLRGLDGSDSVDGGPRIQVQGSHRGSDFDIQIRNNLSMEVEYEGEVTRVPSCLVICVLISSAALSTWLVLFGLPYALAHGPFLSTLGSIALPTTMDEYGTLWLMWHLGCTTFSKLVYGQSGRAVRHVVRPAGARLP